MKPQLSTPADIQQLVDAFYEKVRQDACLAPVFDARIKDWSVHMPTMYRFWSSMLLGTGTYHGQPFDKHQSLPITALHFERWVTLFCQTVDEHFAGEKAEEAKFRAQSIAQIFQYKMNL